MYCENSRRLRGDFFSTTLLLLSIHKTAQLDFAGEGFDIDPVEFVHRLPLEFFMQFRNDVFIIQFSAFAPFILWGRTTCGANES